MNQELISPDILLYALLGGIIPAYIWLRFWLREETHQEPRGKILGSFAAGMFVVFLAIPLEFLVKSYYKDYSTTTLTLWAFIEEILKFGAAYFVVLKSRFVDEPIDPIIYLVSAALGFSAMENILFVLGPLFDGDIAKSISTINLRFLGASVVHIISTGSIGLALGFSFFKSKSVKFFALIIGFIIATMLHTSFNSFIIRSDNTFGIFSLVWIGMFIILVILQKIKTIKNINPPKIYE